LIQHLLIIILQDFATAPSHQRYQGNIYPYVQTISVVVFAVVTTVEALAVKATAVSLPVQFIDLLQIFSAATTPASIQCVLALPESTLCCTTAATALASVDPASADHNPARFRDSSISSAISRQHLSIRQNSHDAHSIYSICSHDTASVLVLQGCATVSSHQGHRCSANLYVHIVTMLILSKLFT